MAKDKSAKAKGKGIPNKHLHARTTFLYQAATYLTLQAGAQNVPVDSTEGPASAAVNSPADGLQGLARELGSQLHTVSRKAQVKLSVELKRSICKSCNTILIPGHTAAQSICNESKGCRKPWANVLAVTCTFCGSSKRYPVGATRQQRKTKRLSQQKSVVDHRVDISTSSAAPEILTATDVSPPAPKDSTPKSK